MSALGENVSLVNDWHQPCAKALRNNNDGQQQSARANQLARGVDIKPRTRVIDFGLRTTSQPDAEESMAAASNVEVSWSRPSDWPSDTRRVSLTGIAVVPAEESDGESFVYGDESIESNESTLCPYSIASVTEVGVSSAEALALPVHISDPADGAMSTGEAEACSVSPL
jgi:hypothetical protein